MSRSIDLLVFFLDGCVYLFQRNIVHKISRFFGTVFYHTFLRRLRNFESRAVKSALGVSKSEANRIALEGFLNLCSFLVDYQFIAIKSDEEVWELIKTVKVEGLEYIQKSIDSGRPIILTSVHIDSFLIGILKLCEFTPANRSITIIKQLEAKKKESRAYEKFKKMGVPLSIFRLSEKPAIETLGRLRDGNILFVLCDVDPNLGKTAGVSFFDKPAQFPCGLVELAIVSKALLVPVVVTRDDTATCEKHILKIEKPIDPLEFHTASFQEKTVQMTQRLVTHVASWIRNVPEQWQSWVLLQLMWSKK